MSNTKTSAPDCGDRNAAHERKAWEVVPFVDNRPQSKHHTYRITPQRGPYGSMLFDDAHLAAAAPDMLKALKLVMAWIDNWSPDFVCDEEWPEDEARILAALAKAEASRV